MKLKEIVDKANIEKAILKLIELYPCQKKNIELYKKVLIDLKSRDIDNLEEPELKILIVDIEELIGNDNQLYTDVSGYSEEEKESYGLDFTDWNEWLSYEGYPNCIKEYGEVGFLAHCLYEITFLGFK